MNNVDELAKIIWNYMRMGQTLKKADAIFVLGSHDTRVAERAAELYLQGWAPVVIFSGNQGALTREVFAKPEAEVFADIAEKLGVPRRDMILETKATNTGENITFTKKLLEEKGLDFKSFILVQKPYMERRTYATFTKQWPGKEFIVTSPQLGYEEFVSEKYPKEYVLNIIVGDMQRIIEYPKKGFQIPQEVPAEVLAAYKKLIDLGYTKHLIKSE